MSDKRAKDIGRRREFRRRFRDGKKAVSPVVATLILILIAVAAAAALYLWLVVWQGSVTSGIGSPGAQYTVTIGGSTSVYPFDQVAVTQFEQNNSDVVVSDNQGGTGAGMIAVCNGQVDIGTASTAETVAGLQASDGCPATTSIQIFAYDAVDVIVPFANPHGLGNVSWDTLTAIYDGATLKQAPTSPASLEAPSIDGVPVTTLAGEGASFLGGAKDYVNGPLEWQDIPACVAGATGCGGSGNPTESESANTAYGPVAASGETAFAMTSPVWSGAVTGYALFSDATGHTSDTGAGLSAETLALTAITPLGSLSGLTYSTSTTIFYGGNSTILVPFSFSYTSSASGALAITTATLTYTDTAVTGGAGGFSSATVLTGASAFTPTTYPGTATVTVPITNYVSSPVLSAFTFSGTSGATGSAVVSGTPVVTQGASSASVSYGFTYTPTTGGTVTWAGVKLSYTGSGTIAFGSGSACGTNDICAITSTTPATSPCGFSVCAGGTGVSLPTDLIHTVARTEASGTTQTFEARLLDAVTSTTFATTASAIAFTGCGGNNLISDCGMVATETGQGNPNVITTVAGDPDSIGYASDGYARESTSGVSCQGVPSAGCGIGLESVGQPGAVQPSLGSTGTIAIGAIVGGFGPAGQTTTKTWTSGSAYGGARPFEYVTTNTPTGEVARFINFVMDPGNNLNIAGESYEVSYYSV